MKRRWLFSVYDFEGDSEYIDSEGKHADYSDAPDFIGTDEEAAAEGDRRADLWEERTGALAAGITRESRGRVG